ncbi:MAG: hypothetical protein QOI59_2115 [Gammaproteobacteria bacterium]|jgi:hypothetical protein|nr:hypothetical protein [Gammaproteobacteria bacterium]
MSLSIRQIFSRSRVLVLATFAIHMGVATAADSTSDIQQKMTELLAGATQAHSTAGFSPRDGKTTTWTADTQEFAGQLLRGTTGPRLGGAEAIKHSEVLVASAETEPQERPYRDIQPAVQQFLLGTQHQSNLSRGMINPPTADARRP